MNLVVWAVVDYARDKNKTDAFVGMLTTCFNGLGELRSLFTSKCDFSDVIFCF